MNILLTGGTGLIGRALCRSLSSAGHSLTVFSRNPQSVKQKCGASVHALASLDDWREDDHYDAVINLAGESIVGPKWSADRKQALWDSRVTLTEKLVGQIARAKQKPAVLISGSAIGFYGDCGDRTVDEHSPPGNDFGASMCEAWEQAATKAETYNIRTCLIRTGLVLSRDGGMMEKVRLPFKLGLGSRISTGQQWMSWIHIEDLVAMIEKLLTETDCQGAFNLCALNPVNNLRFTRSLGRAVSRPAFLVTPAKVLKWIMGESSELLLGGQKVHPAAIMEAGYAFRYPDLEPALMQLLTESKS